MLQSVSFRPTRRPARSRWAVRLKQSTSIPRAARCTLTTSILPQDISCDTVSGGVTLTLPENGGFSATLDSVSGDLTVDGFAGSLHRDEFVYGQGRPCL